MTYFCDRLSEFFCVNVCCLAALALLLYCLLPSVSRRLWELYVVAMVPRDEYPHLPLPPGTLGYPVIGETISFLKKKSDFYEEKVEKYGFIYKTHILFSPTIRVIGAENVKKILLSENTLVENCWPRSTKLLLGSGSITQSSGLKHSVRRRNVMHAFRHGSLEDMVPVVQDVVMTHLRDWNSRGELLAYPECKSLAFSAAASALLGVDMAMSKTSGMHNHFVEFLKNLLTVPFDLPGFGFRKGMKAKQALIDILRDLIPETNKRPSIPIMKALQDSCKQLEVETQREMYEGVLDILFAGHETVASCITNCVMFLGQHKHIAAKLREELKCLPGQSLNLKTVNDLKYLNYVMKEVLRLCPPAGAGFRKVIKSFELGGYLIPRGWTVMFSIRETQRLSPIFKNADQFDPDRWETLVAVAEKERAGYDPARFHFIPFGFGIRGCAGKSYAQLVIKVFLIELVRNCDWELKNFNPVMEYIPVPKAVDDLPVTFWARQEKGQSCE